MNACLKAALALAGTALVAVPAAADTTYAITPRDLGSGYVISGTLTTDGTVGTLGAGNFTDWSIKVSSVSDTFFTPANTGLSASLVQVAGTSLTVGTSPDGISDGGRLTFASGRRFAARVADFTGIAAAGGVASYAVVGAFDTLPLGAASGTEYVAAVSRPASAAVFDLLPLTFSGGITMTGTITTDGAPGPAHIVDWNIRLREAMQWTFDRTNSAILADWGLNTDRRTLTVSGLDAGSFIIGAGRIDLTGVALADFTYDPAGQASFFTPMTYQLLTGLPLDGSGNAAIATAVPEPEAWAEIMAGLGLLGWIGRRRKRAA